MTASAAPSKNRLPQIPSSSSQSTVPIVPIPIHYLSTFRLHPPPSTINQPNSSKKKKKVATMIVRSLTNRASLLRTTFTRSTTSPLTHPTLHPLTARLISTQTRKAIDAAVASAPVVLFMKGTPETPQCGFSRASVQILGLNGVDPAKFAAFNVLEDAELRSGIKEYSDWPTIPQLYVDGEFVGGCDILMNMHKDGSLAQMLEEKKVLVLEEEQGGK